MKGNKLIPIIIFGLIAIIYAFPLFNNVSYWGQMDWDQFTFWNAVPRETILRYHQFPLWNPYSNGGNVALAHTNSLFISPFFLLALIFGPVIGVKISIIIHLFIGMSGMFVLLRSFNVERIPSFLSSFVYMLNSMFALRLAEGHIEWGYMSFVPWLIFLYRKALLDRKYLIFSIMLLSMMFLGGSIDVLSITILMIAVYSIFLILQQKKILPVKAACLIFIGAFLLSAIKFIPMMECLKEVPRNIESNEGTDISMLSTILLSRDQKIYYENTKWTSPEIKINFRGRDFVYGWHEYGAYVGLVPLLLACIGVFLDFSKLWPFFLSSVFLLWVSLGSGMFYNCWHAVRLLPFYSSLHVPSRFILGFIFGVALFAGFGISGIWKMSHNKMIKLLLTITVIFIFIDLFSVDRPLLVNVCTTNPPNCTREMQWSQKYRDFNLFPGISRSSMYAALLENAGVIESYEVVGVKKGNVLSMQDPRYRGEVYLEGENGRARMAFFSPNKIIVDVSATVPERVILNQNYFKGWKVKNGTRVFDAISRNGLISAKIGTGEHRLIFYYMPHSFIIGLLISLCTAVVLAYWFFVLGKRSREKS